MTRIHAVMIRFGVFFAVVTLFAASAEARTVVGRSHAAAMGKGSHRSGSHRSSKSAFRKNGKLKKTVHVRSTVKHGKFRKAYTRKQ